MAVETASLPAFAATLESRQADERLQVLRAVHPDHKKHSESWLTLLDAFEGTGGFLDGGYLWQYAREETPEFEARQKWARYHNHIETLVDLYVRFVFTQGVKRSSKSPEWDFWLEDVDGAGTPMTPFLKQAVSMGLAAGHAGILVDKTQAAPSGPTRADEEARVIATIFTAPSIRDWRYDQNRLAGVKLLEAAPASDLLTQVQTDETAQQYLLWNREGWARFNAEGELVGGDTPGLGLVPLVILRPKASHTSRMLGRALVSNANIVKALYNRASEEDEVLRAGAFSVLTVSIDKDGDLAEARQALSNAVIGSARALVAKGQIEYKTPSQEAPGTLRDNIAYLVREMYRAAHVRFTRDSLAVESGQSIRLQYTELNEMLQGLAKALSQTEREMARAWFAWMEPDETAAQRAFDAAQPMAEYPTEFFLDDLKMELEAWAEALRMGLGETMTRRIKKRAARRIEPEMPQDELSKVDAEIDKMPAEPSMPEPLDRGGTQPDMEPPDGDGDDDDGE